MKKTTAKLGKLFAILAAVCCFTACSGKETSSTSTAKKIEQTTSSVTTVAVAETEEVKVTPAVTESVTASATTTVLKKTETAVSEKDTESSKQTASQASTATVKASSASKTASKATTTTAASTQKVTTTKVTTTKAAQTQKTTTTAKTSSSAGTTIEATGGFMVSGTKLYDANGNEFVLRGVNHAHTWFKGNLDTAIKGIAATGSNCVRIVLSDGYKWTKDDVSSVKNIIQKCKDNKLIAVLEVHDGTGSDSIEALESACNYWIEIKDALIGNEAYVILNISNEWTGKWDNKLWRDGYVSVIPKLREAGIKNTIMVDAGGWGQNAKCIQEYGAEVFAADSLKNTMLSVHMYGTAGKNNATITSALQGATNQNLCVCVGEFGYKHSDGDVKEEYIMKYCTQNNIGYIAWSWKGNGGGVEYLDLALDWSGSRLSTDWGEVVINGENGIKQTSKICSVFK